MFDFVFGRHHDRQCRAHVNPFRFIRELISPFIPFSFDEFGDSIRRWLLCLSLNQELDRDRWIAVFYLLQVLG